MFFRVYISAAILCIFQSQAFAASSTINPTADAFVTTGSDGSLSGNNYGGTGSLAIAPSGKPQGEFQSVIKFDLSATKNAFDTQFGIGQWTIQTITLQLTVSSSSNAIFNTPAAGSFTASWMQNDSWVEGTGNPSAPTTTGITYSTLPNFLSSSDETLGTFAYGGATTGSTTYTLTLTQGFTADVLAGNTVSLRLFAADPNISYLFASRSNPTIAHPVLTVVAVPEPDVTCILLSGLVIVFAARRASAGRGCSA